MKRAVSLAVLAMVALSLSAARALADDNEGVTNGVKGWVTALLDGDPAAVKAHSVGSAEELARWQGMSTMIGAFKKLGDAATAKYPEQGANFSRMFRKPDFSQIQGAKIEIAGDDATLTGKDGKPMKLKKEEGQWKVVLGSMPDAARLEPKQLGAMTDAASTTADEIKDGKHATYIDAMKALGQKMAAAGRRPGAGPGAGPAK